MSVPTDASDLPVRGASSAPSATILWCLHVRAADEVHPTRIYEQALKFADWVTDRFDRFDPGADPNRPFMRAAPAIWPWGAESHAAGIERTEAAWMLPADLADGGGTPSTTVASPTPGRNPK